MFSLGPYSYSSKEELKAKLKQFLATATDGPIVHPVLVRKLQLLLYMHPRAEEKMHGGVDHFRVASNELGSGRGFLIVRDDRTEERFSYKTCIDGEIATKRSRVVEAFRFAVRDQLAEFRERIQLPTVCALTGGTVVSRKQLHIDHKTPFWRILEDFRRSERLSLAAIATRGTGERLCLADSALVTRWQAFHRQVAELQPALKDANQEKGAALDAPPSSVRPHPPD